MSQVLEITHYVTFALSVELKVRHILCWSVMSRALLDRFLFSIQNVVLVSLKPFFRWDLHVVNNLYLTEAIAIHHSMAIAFLPPSTCAFSHESFLASQTLKPISLHWNVACLNVTCVN